ncbi:pyridoxamine 5'-phosphate oxidase family protein [Candidatus Izemoplasma sp. B36]|uniref:pyridoxamine 5'-phosphate oxidase family protein n=1 Tax=Candidatus Izemoplasma sp. B36 TaxID=3242468 RepID=UPI00355825B0
MFRELRRKDKKMDTLTTMEILKNSDVGVLSTIGEDGYPYGVALNYIYYKDKIYFHCAKEGHKLDNIKYNDKVSFTVYKDVHVIGEALTTHYKSVVVFGKARMIESNEEILMLLINKYASIDSEIAKKMIEKEIKITGLVEIEIHHISGKIGIK